MKARLEFTPSPTGGSVRSPTPTCPSGFWFIASSRSAPSRKKSAEGMTTSLYAGMIIVSVGTEPRSKFFPVSASVSVLKRRPRAGPLGDLIHFSEWKKKARRSPAMVLNFFRLIGFSRLTSLALTQLKESREHRAAAARFSACFGLRYDSSRRLFNIAHHTRCHSGPNVSSNKRASRPTPGRKSTGTPVFFKSFRKRFCPMTLPTTAE
mmetsp:Transcript_114639/g.331303  ORF Transcript_114639/g.331303 Transcript_114639/m.331303 type:complete len:208 (-) Transcript_114639:700-1323(-)